MATIWFTVGSLDHHHAILSASLHRATLWSFLSTLSFLQRFTFLYHLSCLSGAVIHLGTPDTPHLFFFFANSLCRFSQDFVRWLALVSDILLIFLVTFSDLPYLCLKGSGHFGSGAFVSCGDSTFWPFGCGLFLHRPNVLLVPLPDVFAGYFFKVG